MKILFLILSTQPLQPPFLHQTLPLAKSPPLRYDRVIVRSSNAHFVALQIGGGTGFAAQWSRLATLPNGVALTHLLPSETVATYDQLLRLVGRNVLDVPFQVKRNCTGRGWNEFHQVSSV